MFGTGDGGDSPEETEVIEVQEEPITPATEPAVAPPAKDVLFAPEEFGVFGNTTGELDQETQYLGLTISLPFGVRVKAEIPLPLVAAWTMDNLAEGLANESKPFKVF